MQHLPGFAMTDDDTAHAVPPGAQPVSRTVWLVASWFAPDERWKIWPDRWLDREAAEAWAKRVLLGKRGHTHYTIFELRFPGL